LVFATTGSVLDLVIDLRVGSPTFHHVWEMRLSPKSKGVLIPAGCAHGFVVIEPPAVLVYAQEGVYDKECDTGVNLSSLTFSSGVESLQLSDRDQALLNVTDFDSPFIFDSEMFAGWTE
jgi:dTDP-4-dehydrorhamnose 3,5-epimerase-like enzyme